MTDPQRPDIDQLLHDADRAVMGAEMAWRMRDGRMSNELDCKAIGLYNAAIAADQTLSDPAWKETGNRDVKWLRENGFTQIAEIQGHD